MKTLSLRVPVGQCFRVVYLDDEDYERVRLFRWRFMWVGRTLVPVIRVEGKTILLSQFIAGVGSDERVRFANKNRLDLQRRNLIFNARTADFAPGYPTFSLHIKKRGTRKRRVFDPGINPAPEFSTMKDYE